MNLIRNMLIIIILQEVSLMMMRLVESKYLEGELNTSQQWTFLTRFCFLSEEGQFEYYIEYDDDGDDDEPNLLLYYDAEDQWPAIYKSDKTCHQMESVLRIEQNQIINLTARHAFYKELSGCVQVPTVPTAITTPRPYYTISVPTAPSRKKLKLATSISSTITTETPTASYEELTPSADVSTVAGEFANETTIAESDLNLDFEEIDGSLDRVKRSISPEPTEPPRRRLKHRVVCHNARRFRSSRARWWFVAVSNCRGRKGIHMRYKISMTNGRPGDYWHEQFSADEFYILPILMAFTVTYACLMLAIVVCSIELKSRHLLHATYKLFVVSVVIQFVGIVITSMSYLKYAVNGVGAPKMKTAGALFMAASETCFILLLLLLAKGYTITRGRISNTSSVKLTVFMCVYVVMCLALFVYEAKAFDPGEVLYLYESPAGYGLIVLRIIGWLAFVYATARTLKRYPEKGAFYRPFAACATLWYVAAPIFVTIANGSIDKWIRESIVYGVTLFVTFAGHLMFVLLTIPSMANKNFPFHVRTTQIGAASTTIEERFNHHVYEPNGCDYGAAIDGQTVIVPLTRGTAAATANDEAIVSGIRYNRSPSLGNRTMDNVFAWSIVKNYNRSLDHRLSPNRWRYDDGMENNDESLKDSLRGPESLNNLTAAVMDARRKSPFINNGFHDDDYDAKEVPVELFTISKIVMKPSAPTLNGTTN